MTPSPSVIERLNSALVTYGTAIAGEPASLCVPVDIEVARRILALLEAGDELAVKAGKVCALAPHLASLDVLDSLVYARAMADCQPGLETALAKYQLAREAQA